jgi:hypothetical protein
VSGHLLGPRPLDHTRFDFPRSSAARGQDGLPWPVLPRRLPIDRDLQLLVLVVDVSISTLRTDPWAGRWRAAAGVVRALRRSNRRLQVAVICFDNTARVAMPATPVRSAIDEIDRLAQQGPGGGTDVGPAAELAARLVAGHADAAAVLWLTDTEAALPAPRLDRLTAEVPSATVALRDPLPGWPAMPVVAVASLDAVQQAAEATVDALRSATERSEP